jgi:hypothetical protein
MPWMVVLVFRFRETATTMLKVNFESEVEMSYWRRRALFQFSSVQHVWRVTCWERKEMICGPIWAPNSIRGKWITTTPPTILFLRMTNPSLHWKLMKRSTKPRTAQTGRVTGYVPVYTNIFFSSLAQWFKALIGSNIGLIFGSTSSTGRTDPILTILWKIIQNYVGLWEKKTLQTSSERISSLNIWPLHIAISVQIKLYSRDYE